ncbi:MAG: UDP-N-acetylglucosamine--N-acetylmuramyl-(pentapeptide) pyrophosphoryl-undecaprenol [Thermoleophilaceae bacterium]|nr:UDP-N-acetylglucosamine--N-acetylmuramyl-(pentapeptide) pyrophosphoryl-undecaprenol [Thermoleophilaceae bacterium]
MRTLLVAAAGGHLKQLHKLLPRIPELDGERVWVTYDTSQSRSLLEGEDVVYGHYMASRDYGNVARNAALAERLLREAKFDRVLSTGSAIALSFLPLARARGVACHYIESAARPGSPSITGNLLRRVPGMRLYTQYRSWAQPPWRYFGSVFDSYVPQLPAAGDVPIRRVVVTLGTSKKYGMRRLVEQLVKVIPPEAEVLWQTGATDLTGLPIEASPVVSATDLDQATREADVVIAHAGTGSALGALEAGRCPILVPRRKAHGENADDHQALIAQELDRRGLAIAPADENVTPEVLARAAAIRIEEAEAPPPCPLAAD